MTAPVTIREHARVAADAIDAMVGAHADALRDMGVGGTVRDFDVARDRCSGALEVLAGTLYERHHIMRGDEVLAMATRTQRGIVSPAWALRVVAIGEECS